MLTPAPAATSSSGCHPPHGQRRPPGPVHAPRSTIQCHLSVLLAYALPSIQQKVLVRETLETCLSSTETLAEFIALSTHCLLAASSKPTPNRNRSRSNGDD